MITDQSVVTSQHPDHDTLNLAAVGVDDAGFHGAVRGLEADLAAFLVEALEGGLAGVEEGDDLLAVAGALAAFDDDEVAVAEVILDHAVAAHLQDVDAALAVEQGLEVQLLAGLDGLDRRAGGDVAEQRELGRALLVGEPLVRHDLQRASLVLVAAEDPLFFQRADVLEDGDLAGAELIGQLLHGRGIAMQMAIVSNGHDHVQLTRSEVHKTAPSYRRLRAERVALRRVALGRLTRNLPRASRRRRNRPRRPPRRHRPTPTAARR